MSIFHHLGLGFWSFLANPAAGLVGGARGQGGQRIVQGFTGGVQSLLGNTVFAFSNATAKAAGSARKVLYLLCSQLVATRSTIEHFTKVTVNALHVMGCGIRLGCAGLQKLPFGGCTASCRASFFLLSL